MVHLPFSGALLYNSVCPYKTKCQNTEGDDKILSVQKHSWAAALVPCRELELSGTHPWMVTQSQIQALDVGLSLHLMG